VPWTREDTRYLIALLAAVGLVAYLLASNYGLVPGPLVGERVRNTQTIVSVPQVSEATPVPLTPAPVAVRTARPAPTRRPSATPPPTGGATSPPTPSPTPTPTPAPCILGLICPRL
jgi:hypothetical protein